MGNQANYLYRWTGPQIRPSPETIFIDHANQFFNLPLVPYPYHCEVLQRRLVPNPIR